MSRASRVSSTRRFGRGGGSDGGGAVAVEQLRDGVRGHRAGQVIALPRVYPSSRSTAACSAFSTPSATVSRPRARRAG